MDENVIVLKGKIDTIFPTEIKGNFEKRLLWLKEEKQNYANVWQLELHGNDGNVLDGLKPGDRIACTVKVRGNQWTKNGETKVFNTLQCTMIK